MLSLILHVTNTALSTVVIANSVSRLVRINLQLFCFCENMLYFKCCPVLNSCSLQRKKYICKEKYVNGAIGRCKITHQLFHWPLATEKPSEKAVSLLLWAGQCTQTFSRRPCLMHLNSSLGPCWHAVLAPAWPHSDWWSDSNIGSTHCQSPMAAVANSHQRSG